MGDYFNLDGINYTLNFLDKSNSFNLLNTSKSMNPLRKVLYGKYLFDHNKIKNDEIRQYIKHIKCSKTDDIKFYSDIISLQFINNSFSGGQICIEELPKTLQNLKIDFATFNQPLDHLPPDLQSLKIICTLFDHSLNNLPKNLQSFVLISHCFNQSINKLPINLKSLGMYCETFNHSLDELPDKLQLMTIKSYEYNQPINKFPKNLKSLSLHCWALDQENIPDKLPDTLESVIINNKKYR